MGILDWMYKPVVKKVGTYIALAGISGTVVGCCPQYKQVDKTNVKKLYLQDDLYNHPAELDCDCQDLNEKGDNLGEFSTRIRWGFAVLNDTFIELPLSVVLGLFGEGGKDLAKYTADKLPGGRLPNDVSDMIIRGDIDGVMQRIYGGEDSKLGGHGALFLVGGSSYFVIDAAQKALLGGECTFDKLFGTNITDVGDGGDGAVAVIPHEPDPVPGM